MQDYPKAPRACDDIPDEKTHFHRKWSSYFRRVKIITVIALVVFVLLMIGLFGNSITYQNLRYLLRDLDAEYNTSDNMISGANYDSAENMSFGLMGNSIVVATPSLHSLYKLSNTRLFTNAEFMASPAVASSEKIFIVYDLGGYTFTVYNSLGELYSETLEYGIREVSASADGSFAVLTQSRGYRSTILVYNSKFSLIAKYETDRYVQRVCLSDDGRYLLVSSFDAASATYYSVTSMYDVTAADPIYTSIEQNALPLDIGFTDDGHAVVICNNRTLIYKKSGELSGKLEYSAGKLLRAAVGDAGVCLILDSDATHNKSTALVIDTDAKEVYNIAIDEKVLGCGFYHNTLFVLTSKHLLATNEKAVVTYTSVPDGADAKRMFPYSDSEVVVAYADHASVIGVHSPQKK